jgi:hypothetical protein
MEKARPPRTELIPTCLGYQCGQQYRRAAYSANRGALAISAAGIGYRVVSDAERSLLTLGRGRIVRRDQASRRWLVISGGVIKGEPGQSVSYLVSTEGGHNTSRIGSCTRKMFHKKTVRCVSHVGTACSARTASPVTVITFSHRNHAAVVEVLANQALHETLVLRGQGA